MEESLKQPQLTVAEIRPLDPELSPMSQLFLVTALAVCSALPGVPVRSIQGALENPIPHPTPVSVVRGFGIATVVRHSNQQKNGVDIAPWKNVTIENVFTIGWKRGPVVGTPMTVIPLGVDLAPITVEIVKAEYGPSPCAPELQPWTWSIRLAPVSSRGFFDAKPRTDRRDDVPFDVAVVYPTDNAARAIDARRIPRSQLPPTATVENIFAAIDLRGDGRVDIVTLRYCCDGVTKATGCNYVCSKTYERVGGRWRLIDSGGPC